MLAELETIPDKITKIIRGPGADPVVCFKAGGSEEHFLHWPWD